MRRNFLRFGKRNGGEPIEIPEDERTEEMEENENLNKFLNFVKHFDILPEQQEFEDEEELVRL